MSELAIHDLANLIRPDLTRLDESHRAELIQTLEELQKSQIGIFLCYIPINPSGQPLKPIYDPRYAKYQTTQQDINAPNFSAEEFIFGQSQHYVPKFHISRIERIRPQEKMIIVDFENSSPTHTCLQFHQPEHQMSPLGIPYHTCHYRISQTQGKTTFKFIDLNPECKATIEDGNKSLRAGIWTNQITNLS